MNAAHYQTALLRSMQLKIGDATLLAEELAEAIGVSKSEAYNKISGRSLLTLPQIAHLCHTYNLPFLINGAEKAATALVEFLPFQKRQVSIDQYLKVLKSFLLRIYSAKEKKIICATDDIPLFHLFKYPELTAFKLYFWSRRVHLSEGASSMPSFTAGSIPAKNIKAAYELYTLYKGLPSVEIWTGSSFLNTVDQIKYAADSGILNNKKLGKKIGQQLKQTLADIEKYAVATHKGTDSPASFEWYYCDIIGSIAYLAQIDNLQLSFIRFNTFNNLQTDNKELCEEVKLWMDSLLYDATGFSGQGSKHRNQYLKEAYGICEELIGKF